MSDWIDNPFVIISKKRNIPSNNKKIKEEEMFFKVKEKKEISEFVIIEDVNIKTGNYKSFTINIYKNLKIKK